MANKVGNLIKKARTDAGMTQEQLAKKVKNTSASDISKAERGELKLTQDALKQIAKATGVTQKSLLDAASASTYKGTGTGSDTKKTGKTAKTAKTAKTSKTAKTTQTSKSDKSSKTTGSTMKVTAAERKLVELYREADASVRKKVTELLKKNEPAADLGNTLEMLLGDALDLFSKK